MVGHQPRRQNKESCRVVELDGGIGPPVVSPAGSAAVIQSDALFENGAGGPEHILDAPFHAADAVGILDDGASRPVGLGSQREIDRRGAVARVCGGEIGFDAKRHPRASQTDQGLPDHWIRVEHLTAAQFVPATV